jgi:hypothetical protein
VRWRNRDLGDVSLAKLARDGEGGRRWYVDSRAAIAEYSAARNVDPAYVSDVLAIVSPRVTVEHSVRLADAYIMDRRTTGMMGGRIDALGRYERSGVFGGPKVNAFSAALQGDSNAVVVDAWMFRAAREKRTTPKAYLHVAQQVIECAYALEWPVAETQAAIWQGARAFVGYHSGYAPMVMP